MPKFLLSYRVPENYQPGTETRKLWRAWFDGLGRSRADTGHPVLAPRALGNLGAGTRLGGYSVVTADDMEGAAALAGECPALKLGGGVEIGAIPEPPVTPPGEAATR